MARPTSRPPSSRPTGSPRCGAASHAAARPQGPPAPAAPERPPQGRAQMQGFQPARLPEPTEAPGTQLVEPTRMMKVIGERVTEGKQHGPALYATAEGGADE